MLHHLRILEQSHLAGLHAGVLFQLEGDEVQTLEVVQGERDHPGQHDQVRDDD